MSATITVHEPDAEGRVFVDVVGTINDEDFKTFKDKTDQIYPIGAGLLKKQMIVTLVSYGGSINPALQIGDLIRKRGLSTFVPGDRTCTSACALIWLAGVPRTVGDTPQIGFHAAYDRTSKREVGSTNAVVGAYLRDLGVGYKAIVFMTRKGPTSVEWLTPDLAMQFGVTWAMLQRPRAIPIPPQQKLQPHLRTPPEVIAAWSKWAAAQLPTATAPPSPKPMPVMPPVPGAQDRPKSLHELLEKARQQREQSGIPSANVEEPPIAARPKITDRVDPGGQQASVAQKVALYEEDLVDPNGKRFVGSVIWRTAMVTVVPGQPRELAIRADIEVPERKLAVTWSLRRNTDKGMPATHVVEILFKLPADFPSGGISNVPGILMKQGEQTRGVPLAGLAVKVTPAFYMIGLSNMDADKDRNLHLLKERAWFDIPVVYNNNGRAILALEKGSPGARAFADAFETWKQDELKTSKQ